MSGFSFKQCFKRKCYPLNLIFTLFLLSGCGYHAGLEPEPSFSPERANPLSGEVLAIPLFSNASSEPLLEKTLTQVVKETLSRRGWEIEESKGKAHFILAGHITRFGQTAISLSLLGAAREYRVRVELKTRLLNAKDGKALRTFVTQGLAEYRAQPDAGRDRIAKNRAIREAGQKMANEIAVALSLFREKKLGEATHQ